MIRSLILHFDLLFAYLGQFVKTRFEYKADFFIGLFVGVLFHIVTLIFIDVLFAEQARTLNGWTKAQVFFIYGFSILPMTLFSAFFTNLYMFSGTYIIDGQFDRVLLRPLDSLFQVLLERVNIERLFGLIIGVVIMYYAGRQMEMEWNLWKIFLVLFFSFCGLLVYAGVFITLAALSFWWPDRMGLLPPVYNLTAFGKYPVTIYNPLLQFLLKWIIPFAFVAFYPATEFMDRREFQTYVWLTPVVAVVSLAISMTVWRLGVKKYESTGS